MLRSFLFALAVSSCTSAGHPPTARIAFSPAYLPAGDNYQTDLALDGSASRNDVDDPQGLMQLAFAWEIDDPRPVITAGALDAAKVTVRIAAAHPTTVSLAVTDGAGDSGRATVRVGVTVPP